MIRLVEGLGTEVAVGREDSKTALTGVLPCQGRFSRWAILGSNQ